MDTATLVRAALDEGQYAALKHSMPMTQFWVRTDSGWRGLAGHAGPRLSP